MNDELRNLVDIDRVIHEPARLLITAVLYTVESADFLYLLHATELTKGNLSSHLMRLEKAGYVAIEKTFEGKTPRTVCRLTEAGQEAFETYRQQMKAAI
ncbi:MAG: transcriptional regulator [Ardenticatenaceae bacterium]|nr:transcriptional regulator [Ardenticatenaceae bacterium]MCB9446107.1 transcriptional regulator [Ardenticatenaceae bacterium]